MGIPSNYEQLSLVIAFVVPGYIIGTVRSRFVTGRWGEAPQTLIIESILFSILFFGVFSPVVSWVSSVDMAFIALDVSIRAVVFVLLPIVLGILLGLEAYYDCLFKALRYVGFSIVHNMPTAWDWKFSRFNSSRVIVTLKDGTVYLGFLGKHSSFSSVSTERDLYIDCIYDEVEECWKQANKSLYIAGDQVKTIEFIIENETNEVNS
ncbi:MAG: DUF6338 family protein [Methyloligellaceae bacterium]